MLALVSWLSARSLEQTLQELRTINANLDQVVIERTQALAESLERERIEAGRNQAILNSIADGVIVFDTKMERHAGKSGRQGDAWIFRWN